MKDRGIDPYGGLLTDQDGFQMVKGKKKKLKIRLQESGSQGNCLECRVRLFLCPQPRLIQHKPMDGMKCRTMRIPMN